MPLNVEGLKVSASTVDRLQAPQPVRERAIGEMLSQLQAWDVTLPAVEPLVLDFGQADFSRLGLIELWIANELKAGYCGKYLYLADGQHCPEHFHRLKHETFFVVKGRVQMQLEGRSIPLIAGSTLPMPAGMKHGFCGDGPALILEISTPCLPADNCFTDSSVDNWLRSVTA